nr:MAG TPA: hypothetical protein [Caudoviricetes sp.]
MTIVTTILLLMMNSLNSHRCNINTQQFRLR